MTREEAHQLVDQLYDTQESVGQESAALTAAIETAAVTYIGDHGETPVDAPVRVLPEGKRVVRTKTSGDRVYLLDETKGTRQWVTNPEVLKSLGFEIEDVTEVDDNELLKFQMGPALYRVAD